MRAMASSLRVAIVIDDEPQRKRFVAHIHSGARVYEMPGGAELLRLAAARAVDLVIAGVLHQNDEFLPAALRELARTAPDIAMVGVFEPSRPSLDEAADLAREIPFMGFVSRPGARFEYLTRPRGSRPPTFTPALLTCMDQLPLFGAARAFARLQALHPSFALSIPEQAKALGVSRRNLERWFQGPDICSAGCFQSVCAAGEAAYLRLACGLSDLDIASVVEVLTRDGLVNPLAVPRTIRTALRAGLDELRTGGTSTVTEAVEAALRTSRYPGRAPAQWGPDTRYAPEKEVLRVPIEGRVALMDPAREVVHSLDSFGLEAWSLVMGGAPFGKITAELAAARREPAHAVRAQLISWLGELLVLRLIRREPGSVEAGEA